MPFSQDAQERISDLFFAALDESGDALHLQVVGLMRERRTLLRRAGRNLDEIERFVTQRLPSSAILKFAELDAKLVDA